MSIRFFEPPQDKIIDRFQQLESEFTQNRLIFNEWLQKAAVDLGASRRLFDVLHNDENSGVLLIHIIDNSTVKLNALIIYPQFRNKGIATRAMKMAVTDLLPDVSWYFTQCRSNDIRALRLEERVGFHRIGLLRHLRESADNILFAYNNKNEFSLETSRKLAIKLYSRPDQQLLIGDGTNA